jgi:hypothetical protein
MVDSAAMHLVLSNAALHLNDLRGNQGEDLTILAHNAAALQSVNLRMAKSNEEITDGLIGAILGVRKRRMKMTRVLLTHAKLICHDVELVNPPASTVLTFSAASCG